MLSDDHTRGSPSLPVPPSTRHRPSLLSACLEVRPSTDASSHAKPSLTSSAWLRRMLRLRSLSMSASSSSSSSSSAAAARLGLLAGG